MTRVGVAFGASPITFLSLAGVGDLFLTCSSENSRNYTVGYRLGKGEELQHILDTLGSVAEGVATTKGYKKIIDRVGVEAPIANGIYRVLYEVRRRLVCLLTSGDDNISRGQYCRKLSQRCSISLEWSNTISRPLGPLRSRTYSRN